ncbi:MAG TPA: serine hydrolase [Chloroflexota bacterium]|nr:serine hydrolase [Chloroflexota bacterium]
MAETERAGAWDPTAPGQAAARDSGAARIARIEAALRPESPLRSEPLPPIGLAELMARYRVPGVSVAVIDGGGVAWARGYGVLETGRPAPVTPDTAFQACSISKAVAAAVALCLVQEGSLDLDEDVNRYLTSWKVPANGAWQPRVTLRQLLSHTAGLTGNWYRGFRRGEPVPALLDVLEGRAPANTPPVRAVLIPGTRYRYSGSHYTVLQQLLIDRTGRPFPELAEERVFAPLGMHHSSYDQAYPDSHPDSAAAGHYIGGEPVHGKWRIVPEMAGAGLWTTPTDLARLLIEVQRAHAGDPGRLWRPEIIRQALTEQPGGYGLGFSLSGTGPQRRFGHGGDNIGYKCTMEAYVERGLGAVVMTNGDDGYLIVEELSRAIAEEYAWPGQPQGTASPPAAPPPLDAETWRPCAGTYELRPGLRLTVAVEDGSLRLTVPGQPPIPLTPRSESECFAQAVNVEITFTRTAGGEVAELELRQESQTQRAPRLS